MTRWNYNFQGTHFNECVKKDTKTERKGNIISPLSVWSLVSASSHSMSREFDDGNWWWHGRVALSPTTFSHLSLGTPLTAGWIELRKKEVGRGGGKNRGGRGREMSDGDTWELRQEADAADRKPIEDIETEDAARDMTQNPNHYLTDAEIRHTRTLRREDSFYRK